MSDCFNAEDIGRGSAFYGLAPRLGPAVGPLVGEFIVQNLGVSIHKFDMKHALSCTDTSSIVALELPYHKHASGGLIHVRSHIRPRDSAADHT